MKHGAFVIKAAYRGGYDGRPGWWLALDYNADRIEDLKAAIPAKGRTWDQERQEWWVDIEWELELLRVLPSLEAFKAQGSLL